ncbi:hypothetical protein Slin15195_G000210 [Septoria linicola]|uniref:Rhodopsin domain-containing protein n=1 Tax=Septoria linicola TaxID=215465 RepID=A0A9Q9AD62_9PEZI|nr:hypothetical protein Slin15195_G000210 [Septoria linicola]
MVSGHASPGAVLAVVLTMTVVACVFVGMRIYARLGMARNAGADDLCIVVSMLFAIATTVTMIVQVQTGMGRHAKDIEPHEVVANLKAFWVSTWVYNLSLTLTKVSILFQYLRIFPQKWFRISTWTLMGVIVTYGLYVVCSGIWLCRPIAFFWDPTIVGGRCLNRFNVWFANAGLNIATDIATTVLPLPVLNKLELPKRQKRALMLVFALGGFTCIISILRLQSLYIISNTKDVSWENPLAAIWSCVEMCTAIIASCLPTIRCLFPRLLKATSLASRSFPGLQSDAEGGTARAHWGGSASGGGGKSTFRFGAKAVTTTTTNSTHHYANGAYRPMRNDSAHIVGSMETFGGGIKSGVLVGKTKSHIRAQDSLGDIELRQHMPFPDGRIHVLTSIDQDVVTQEGDGEGREGGGRASPTETESTKDLVLSEKKPADCF